VHAKPHTVSPTDRATIPAVSHDAELVEALRRGDEAAFAEIADRWGPALLRLARLHVPSQAVAEEVVQETWLAVLRGIDRFEGRSSLRTWVFGILLNLARTHGRRERRTLPFAALRERWHEHRDEPAVPSERFQGPGDPRPDWWSAPPDRWADPEERLQAAGTREMLGDAIAALPARQREVIVLRDVLGLSAEEVCTVLEVSDGNQRVLLHRARAKVRAALERYLGGDG
jgi:RNA polymerase sigma-70 factor (ECF subfamily)